MGYVLTAGVVRPSMSPSMGIPSGVSPKERWRSPFLCRLPDRQLNAQAIFDAYPMPRVEIFDSVGATRVMSTLDLAKGYWQVPMSSSCREDHNVWPL